MYQEWRGKTLPQMIEYSARVWPENIAILEGEEAVTYADLARQIELTKIGLKRLGVKPGDHVAHFMRVDKDWVRLFFAATGLGARLVPLNLTWVNDELTQGLKLTDTHYLIIGQDHRGADLIAQLSPVIDKVRSGRVGCVREVALMSPCDRAPHLPDLDTLSRADGPINDAPLPQPDDVAMLLLTSGSTAFPKPAMHTHETILAGMSAFADGMEASPEDIMLQATPNYHVGGIDVMGLTLMRGGTLRLMDWFDPKLAMELIEKDKVTLFWGFDTHFTEMLRHPDYLDYNLSSITRTIAGANPSSFDQIKSMGFEHVGVVYGSTEYMGSQSYFPYRDRFDVERMKQSNGRPTTSDIRIIDPETGKKVEPGAFGEICCRGPALFKGYYNMPEKTAEDMDADGFFHTGDYGFVDEDGYVYYRGRYKEMVKSGGENVAVLEVEMFLASEIEGIERVAVCGVPDPKWGEAVSAVVELSTGVELDEKQIRSACRGKLAGYKIPKHVVILESKEWPVTPTGKLDRSAIRDYLVRRLNASNS